MRPGSPPFGFSTLTTSAPSWARTSVQVGPASNCDKSRTRTPARQFGGTALVSMRRLRESWASPHDNRAGAIGNRRTPTPCPDLFEHLAFDRGATAGGLVQLEEPPRLPWAAPPDAASESGD